MSKVYYWSDLHIGHLLVAQMRGFQTVEEHDNHIVERWESTINKRDTVWILGDLAMASPRRALELIKSLPGTKNLILGNHDQAHPMHRRSHRQQARYFEAFQSVQTMDRHSVEGREMLVSHFPYAGSGDHSGKDERYMQYRLADHGLPLIHGHVHDEWKVRGKQVNVGVDKWMDGPASSQQVLEALDKEIS